MTFYLKFLNFFAVFISCLLTIYISKQGFSNVFASSFITILMVLLTLNMKEKNNIADSIFCGSFAGMISMDTLLSTQYSFLTSSLLLSILVGIIYTTIKIFSCKYPKYFFNGFGGKLGTSAFLSVIVFIIISDKSIFSFFKEANIYLSNYILIITSIVGAFSTMIITQYSYKKIPNHKKNIIILASAVLGFLGFLILKQEVLAQAFYAGTFAGMTSLSILSKKQIVLSGFITGFFFIVGSNFFNGFGGKLGTTAFLAVVVIFISNKIFYKLFTCNAIKK